MASKEKRLEYLENFSGGYLYRFLKHSTSLHKDFILCKGYTDEEKYLKIYINDRSLGLAIKAFLFKYPQAIYLSSAFNLFQSLNGYTDYFTFSHSLTLYYLKILERCGIVLLDEYTKISGENYTSEYRIVGNGHPKREKMAYDIWFHKLRDIDESDLEQIRRVERVFNIPEGTIIYTVKNGKFKANLNKQLIMDNLKRDEADKQTGKSFQIKKRQ